MTLKIDTEVTTNITKTDGYYIVTGSQATIHYSIADGDVPRKKSMFTDLKLLKADGSALTEEEITAGGFEEVVAITENIRAGNLGILDLYGNLLSLLLAYSGTTMPKC